MTSLNFIVPDGTHSKLTQLRRDLRSVSRDVDALEDTLAKPVSPEQKERAQRQLGQLQTQHTNLTNSIEALARHLNQPFPAA